MPVETRTWPEPVQRVTAYLRESGAEVRVEEFKEGTPTAEAAARAVASSASGWARPWAAIGAIATGSVDGTPKKDVAGSIVRTSTSTRGRSRRRRQAASLATG